MSKTHWTEVDLFLADGTLVMDWATRRRAMTEYRLTGAIGGVWLVDPTEDADGEDASSYEGPGVEEIDWSGWSAFDAHKEHTS